MQFMMYADKRLDFQIFPIRFPNTRNDMHSTNAFHSTKHSLWTLKYLLNFILNDFNPLKGFRFYYIYGNTTPKYDKPSLFELIREYWVSKSDPYYIGKVFSISAYLYPHCIHEYMPYMPYIAECVLICHVFLLKKIANSKMCVRVKKHTCMYCTVKIFTSNECRKKLKKIQAPCLCDEIRALKIF